MRLRCTKALEAVGLIKGRNKQQVAGPQGSAKERMQAGAPPIGRGAEQAARMTDVNRVGRPSQGHQGGAVRRRLAADREPERHRTGRGKERVTGASRARGTEQAEEAS